MSTTVKIILASVAALFLVIIISIFSIIGIHNDCVHQESGLKAQYQPRPEQLRQLLRQTQGGRSSPGHVPEQAQGIVRQHHEGPLWSRRQQGHVPIHQGAESDAGSVRCSLNCNKYRSWPQLIRGYQKTLLDKKRVYENTLGSFPGSFFAGMMGFPKMDL